MMPDEKKPIPWGLPPLAGPPLAGPPPPATSATGAGNENGPAEPLPIDGDSNESGPAEPLLIDGDGKEAESDSVDPGSADPGSAGKRQRRRMVTLVIVLALVGAVLLCFTLPVHRSHHHAYNPAHRWPQETAAVPPGVQELPRDSADAINRLVAGAFNRSNTVAWDRLAEMTDLFGHRMTASDAYDRSARWVVDTANKHDSGAVAYTEPVSVRQWVRNHESLRLLIPTRPGGGVDLKVLGLGNSAPTPEGGVEARVVPVHSFAELAALGNATVAGSIVLFNFPYTSYGDIVAFRVRGAQEAEKYGARAVLVRTLAPDTSFDSVHTGSSVRAGIPAASISLADANLIERLYTRAQASPDHAAPRARLTMAAALLDATKESSNVIIDLKGSSPLLADEIVLLSGHFDSWDVGVGAMDDGAGAFLAWEALRMVAASGRIPKRTIRVVMWNNEETLQLGAKAYYAKHQAEIGKHCFAIESDIGVFDPWGLIVAADKSDIRMLRHYGETLLRRLGGGNIAIAPNQAPGEDIAILCNSGVPCAGFLSRNPETGAAPGMPGWTDHYFRHHHAESDRMEVIDKDQLRRSSAALAAWAYLIADL